MTTVWIDLNVFWVARQFWSKIRSKRQKSRQIKCSQKTEAYALMACHSVVSNSNLHTVSSAVGTTVNNNNYYYNTNNTITETIVKCTIWSCGVCLYATTLIKMHSYHDITYHPYPSLYHIVVLLKCLQKTIPSGYLSILRKIEAW